MCGCQWHQRQLQLVRTKLYLMAGFQHAIVCDSNSRWRIIGVGYRYY